MTAGAERRYLWAIDPGLDELVVVVADLARYLDHAGNRISNAAHPDMLREDVHVHTLRAKSPAVDGPAERVQTITAPLDELERSYPAYHVVVEVPRTLVPYGRNTGLAVAKLALSIGAVTGWATARGLAWSSMLPDRKPAGYDSVKNYRREHVHLLAAAAGARLQRSQDVIDAQWLAVRWLCLEGPRMQTRRRRGGAG